MASASDRSILHNPALQDLAQETITLELNPEKGGGNTKPTDNAHHEAKAIYVRNNAPYSEVDTDMNTLREALLSNPTRFLISWEFLPDLPVLRRKKARYEVSENDYLGYKEWTKPTCSHFNWNFLCENETLQADNFSMRPSHPRVEELSSRHSKQSLAAPIPGSPHSLEPLVTTHRSSINSRFVPLDYALKFRLSQEIPTAICGSPHSLDPKVVNTVPLVYEMTYPTERTYEMIDGTKRIALVFENVEYEERVQKRHWSDLDREKLVKLWEFLGFEVITCKDYRRGQILKTLEDYANIDHSKTSCFVCCFLAHGEMGRIHTVDNGLLDVYQDIVGRFSSTKCPGLIDKPKLFFFQSCRLYPQGSQSCPDFPFYFEQSDVIDNAVTRPLSAMASTPSPCLQLSGLHGADADVCCAVDSSDTSPKQLIVYPINLDQNEADSPSFMYVECQEAPFKEIYTSKMADAMEGAARFIQSERDFLVSWATMPGELAIRQPHTGSQYVRILDRLMREYAGKRHVAEIMDDVAIEVRHVTDKIDVNLPRGQLPVKHTSLQKYLFLKPHA